MKTKMTFAGLLFLIMTTSLVNLNAQTPIGNWKWEGKVHELDQQNHYFWFNRLRLSENGTFQFSFGKSQVNGNYNNSISVETWRKGTYKLIDNKLYLTYADTLFEYTTHRGYPEGVKSEYMKGLHDQVLDEYEENFKKSTTDWAVKAETEYRSFLISKNTLTELILQFPIPEKEDEEPEYEKVMIKDTTK